ncbi:hypothetical protein OG345_34965 [Streptomyces sp. NBC_01220]|uniref:hypothetical protein n=1 Tax=unclassified Streptomyces TaxID=2593676 RepID=UPI0034353A76|nr:hypothetical protein OG345_34965 [Streptomyces sp. NBC_01220]
MVATSVRIRPSPDQPGDGELTFTGEDLDTRCRYGERTHIFDGTRRHRATPAAAAPHTWDEVPAHLYRIPRQDRRLLLEPVERQQAAHRLNCLPWHIGPCAGCGTPINRYGPSSYHACTACRRKVTAGSAASSGYAS